MNQRRKRSRSRIRHGLSALEVVIVTAGIIPALVALLYVGHRAMKAFLSILGTMIGSPFM